MIHTLNKSISEDWREENRLIAVCLLAPIRDSMWDSAGNYRDHALWARRRDSAGLLKSTVQRLGGDRERW